jgi:ERI1 exoribonuclease 3
LYNLDTRKVEATFHNYVRPVQVPELTDFCTNLTGIEQVGCFTCKIVATCSLNVTQSTVDGADSFPTVYARFEAFMLTHKLLSPERPFAFLTCGRWDLVTMLPAQLALSRRVDTAFAETEAAATASLISERLQPSHFDSWINVKRVFAKQHGLPPRKTRGMASMLKKCNLELEGRHHSGIDDCKNILRIVQTMQDAGWQPTTDDLEH